MLHRYSFILFYITVFLQIQINHSCNWWCKKPREQITFNKDTDIIQPRGLQHAVEIKRSSNNQKVTENYMTKQQSEESSPDFNSNQTVLSTQNEMDTNYLNINNQFIFKRETEIIQTDFAFLKYPIDVERINNNNITNSIINNETDSEQFSQGSEYDKKLSIIQKDERAKIPKRKKLKMHLYAAIFLYVSYENSVDTETFMQIMIRQNIPAFTSIFSQFQFPSEFCLATNYHLTLMQYMIYLEIMYKINPQIILPVSILQAFFQVPKTVFEILLNDETVKLCLYHNVNLFVEKAASISKSSSATYATYWYYSASAIYNWQKKFITFSNQDIISGVDFPKFIMFTFYSKPPLILNILDLKIKDLRYRYSPKAQLHHSYRIFFDVEVHGHKLKMEFCNSNHSNLELQNQITLTKSDNDGTECFHFDCPVYKSTELGFLEYKFERYSFSDHKFNRYRCSDQYPLETKLDLKFHSILIQFF